MVCIILGFEPLDPLEPLGVCKHLCKPADIVPCLDECSRGWRWNVVTSVSGQDGLSECLNIISIASAEGLTLNLVGSNSRDQIHCWLADDNRHKATFRTAEH